MKYSEQSHITSLEDVQNFAKYLYHDKSVAFHPDEDFADYIHNDTGKQTFSKKEISLFNRLTDECFEVCVRENKDIYEVMAEFHPFLN